MRPIWIARHGCGLWTSSMLRRATGPACYLNCGRTALVSSLSTGSLRLSPSRSSSREARSKVSTCVSQALGGGLHGTGCLKNGHDELQDGWHDLLRRSPIRRVEPLLDRAIDSPAGRGGDDLRRKNRSALLRHALHNHALNGGRDRRLNQWLEGVVPGASLG